MRDLYIRSKVGVLPIGRRGENLVARVIYPGVPEEGQVITVFIKRNGDAVAYPASNTVVTDTEVIWTVTSVDTDKQGYGQVQYRYTNAETGEVLKTDIFAFFVGMAIDTEVGPTPDPYESWLDSLTDLAGQVQIDARAAESAAESASASAEAASASAESASGSASQASGKATEAAGSATTASQKASEAASSASAAAGSATAASASATTATTKASEASASATAAQTAQTGAETARAGAESAAQTAQAGADAVGLLREQIYNSYPNVEAEAGPIVSITDGADGIPVKSLVVGIEPVQAGSGDPSPDNVRPITGWTGATVTVCGKNISPTDVISMGKPGERTATINPNIPIKAGQYKASWELTNADNISWGCGFYQRRAGTSAKSVGALNVNTGNLTLSDYANYAYFYMMQSGYDAGSIVELHNFQLELGSTATDYEPYQGTTYPITFPSEAGTVYGGSLDVTKGVLTVDRAMTVYDGTGDKWIKDTTYNYFRTKAIISDAINANASENTFKSNLFPYGNIANTTATTGACLIWGTVRVRLSNMTKTIDEFNAMLSETPLQVVYRLAEPLTYQLTPQEVITTLHGSNSIWADTGDVSLAYRADPKLYIDGIYLLQS